MKTESHSEYRVSQRVVLTVGDKFRAIDGPYWKTSDGKKVPMTARGPYRFFRYVTHGAVGWIEAIDRDGSACVLHVSGKRRRIDVSLVPRPYKIKSKLRKAK